jgi:hypothetical protein
MFRTGRDAVSFVLGFDSVWFGWEASEGGASRCLGLLVEVSTVFGLMVYGSWFAVFGKSTYAHW